MCGLVLLRVHSDSAVVLCNRDSLVVDEAGMFPRVLVCKIVWIARELDASTRVALHQVCILGSLELCEQTLPTLGHLHLRTTSQIRSLEIFGRSILIDCVMRFNMSVENLPVISRLRSQTVGSNLLAQIGLPSHFIMSYTPLLRATLERTFQIPTFCPSSGVVSGNHCFGRFCS